MAILLPLLPGCFLLAGGKKYCLAVCIFEPMLTNDEPVYEEQENAPDPWSLSQVGEKVRRLREIKGMKQESVAQELGMTTNGYGKIERGESSITLERLEQIARVLEMSPLDILRFDEKTVYHIQNMNSSAPQGVVNNYAATEKERALMLEQIKMLNELIANQAQVIESIARRKT
jgi:transcriptional regulator with XRE-family HTH domain